MDRGGEALETWILCSLPRYKNHMEKLKRAEEVLKKHDNSTSSPPTQPLEEALEVEPPVTIEQEEEEPVVSQKEVIGKNQVQNLRANQIRKLLSLIKKVIGSDEILQLENLEDLIKNALSQSKKKLANQQEFYDFLFQNNLAHYVRNRHAIAQFYNKTPWYLI